MIATCPAMLLFVFRRIFFPFDVVICIWLVMTEMKLIKKSFISFSEGKTEEGRWLLLLGILLPVLMGFLYFLGISAG